MFALCLAQRKDGKRVIIFIYHVCLLLSSPLLFGTASFRLKEHRQWHKEARRKAWHDER
jgi:hypothetical protein